MQCNERVIDETQTDSMLTIKAEQDVRYDTIEEFNVDSKAEYSALSSTRSQNKKAVLSQGIRAMPL